MSRSSDRVAILGSGLIGRAWAIAFVRAGRTCALWDPQPEAPTHAAAEIERLLAERVEGDLMRGRQPFEVRARMEVAGSLRVAEEIG